MGRGREGNYYKKEEKRVLKGNTQNVPSAETSLRGKKDRDRERERERQRDRETERDRDRERETIHPIHFATVTFQCTSFSYPVGNNSCK